MAMEPSKLPSKSVYDEHGRQGMNFTEVGQQCEVPRYIVQHLVLSKAPRWQHTTARTFGLRSIRS